MNLKTVFLFAASAALLVLMGAHHPAGRYHGRIRPCGAQQALRRRHVHLHRIGILQGVCPVSLSHDEVIAELVTAIIASGVEGNTDIPAVLEECYNAFTIRGHQYYERTTPNIIDSVRRNTK